MFYNAPYNQSQPIVEKVRVLDGELQFIDNDSEALIFEVTEDGVIFYNSAGTKVLEVNKDSILWLGGSVIADSSRTTVDITSDSFTKSVTCASGQVMDLTIYVERPTNLAYAVCHVEIINWKSTFLPKVTVISSESQKSAGSTIDIAVNTSIGGTTADIVVTNAAGGKLVYESRYRLAMSY